MHEEARIIGFVALSIGAACVCTGVGALEDAAVPPGAVEGDAEEKGAVRTGRGEVTGTLETGADLIVEVGGAEIGTNPDVVLYPMPPEGCGTTAGAPLVLQTMLWHDCGFVTHSFRFAAICASRGFSQVGSKGGGQGGKDAITAAWKEASSAKPTGEA